MNQLAIDFTAPRLARDAGIAAAASHAEREAEGWSDRAYDALCSFCRLHSGERFTSYDFRQWARGFLDEPPTPKAFGSVFQRAAKAGVIRKVGFAQHPERHLSPTVEWEAE